MPRIRFVKQKKIPVIDLYSFTVKQVPAHDANHVHYDEITKSFQVAFQVNPTNFLGP